MMQVRISTQPTRLSTHTQAAILEQRSQRAQVQITGTPAQPRISQGLGTLTIDNYPCRAARGLKSSADFLQDMAQKGLQATQEAISQYVQTGDRLAQISSPSNTVVQMVTDQNTSRMQPMSINLAHVPLPDISYQMRTTRIDWTPAQLRYQVQSARVQGNYTPGAVDTQVTQYADVDIQAVDSGSHISLSA
ncbi:MAG: DUF6470 family protein [Negativicutes bacterium]